MRHPECCWVDMSTLALAPASFVSRTLSPSHKARRCIATRYDKQAVNFLAAIHLAAAVGCWL